MQYKGKLFDHGPLTRLLLSLLVSLCVRQSQAAAPVQPAVPTIDVRVTPVPSTVMPATITMVVATTTTVGSLIRTLAGQQNLVRGRIRLLFIGRILGADEVIGDIYRFTDGSSLILSYAAPAAAAVGAAAAAVARASNQPKYPTAAQESRRVFPKIAALAQGTEADNFLEGLPFFEWNPSPENCRELYTWAFREVQPRIKFCPPRSGRNPPHPSCVGMAFIRIVVMIMNLGHENITHQRGAQGDCRTNKILAIMGYYILKGHSVLNDDFI